MDASDQQRIQELTQEIVTRFAGEFTKSYTQRLVEKVKADLEGGEPNKYQLEKAPPLSEPLKKGTLSKQGGFFKSWKVRHFIAYNEADNYRIDYLEKEGGKVKGSISCCGYHAELFDSSEESKIGEFGIKLVGSANRRVWYIKAANKEEQDEWYQVFRTCCWKAGPQRNPDAIVADAFQDAYWTVRWYYCLWGSYTPWGTEDERLCDLMLSVLDREVIRTVVSKLPAGPARSTIESTIRTPIEASVKAAAGGSWTSSVSACSGLRATLETSIKTLIAPLIEQQVKVKDTVVSTAGGIVNPVVAEFGGRILSPVLGEACEPIGKAYAACTVVFAKKMKELIKSGDALSTPEKTMARVQQVTNYSWWSLYSCFQIVDKLCRDKLSKLPAPFWENISYWTISYLAQDAMTELFHNACYTFQKKVLDAGAGINEGQQEAILAEVMAMYAHDARVSIREFLANVLRRFLETAVQDLMLKPILATVAPVQEQIDAIPVPGLATLINLSDIAEECVERIVREALLSLIDSGFMAALEADIASIHL